MRKYVTGGACHRGTNEKRKKYQNEMLLKKKSKTIQKAHTKYFHNFNGTNPLARRRAASILADLDRMMVIALVGKKGGLLVE